jgi:hypothetical protein
MLIEEVRTESTALKACSLHTYEWTANITMAVNFVVRRQSARAKHSSFLHPIFSGLQSIGMIYGKCSRSHILFFFFGATALIWALAYLHETLRFTSVY